MGKNNLDDIIIKWVNVLPEIKTRSWEKKELESEALSIKITKTEMNFLLRKKDNEAGRLAPLGTYVKDFLRNETDLLGDVKKAI